MALSTIFQRQEIIINLAAIGNYTAGSIKIVRIGNQVTISALSNLTHASNSQPSTGSGIIPEWARPSVVKYNIYLATTSGSFYRVDVDPNGTLGTVYFNTALALVALTDASNGISITYTV